MNNTHCLKLFTKSTKNILIYGLSGDPPTGKHGHRGIIEYLIKENKNNKNKSLPCFEYIFILPTYKYAIPEKIGHENTYDFRYKLIKENFKDINDNIIKVLPLEKEVLEYVQKTNKNRKSAGSYDVLSYLREKIPNANFYWCSGADSFNDCVDGYWGHSLEILATTGWIVIPRELKPRVKYAEETVLLLRKNKNNKLANKIENAPNNTNLKYKQLTLTKKESKEMIETKLKVKYPNLKTDKFHFVNGGDLKNISSTKLRSNLEELLSVKLTKTQYDKKLKKLKNHENINSNVLNLLLKNEKAKKRYGSSS